MPPTPPVARPAARPSASANRFVAMRAALLAALPIAVLAALLGLAFSGAAAPTLVGDAGAVVRWGRPVVSVAAEVAAALTIGSLVLVVCVLPRNSAAPGSGSRAASGSAPRARATAADGGAWARVATVAMVSGPVWAVLLVADLVLGYASTAGRPIGGAGFGDELAFYLTQISAGRAGLVAAALAAVAGVACVAVSGFRTAWVALVLSVVVLIPIATTGHTAGSANHELGMSGLWLHVLSAAIWIGALGALCLVARRLGSDLPAVAARFSRIALWCYVGVAASGITNAWIRIGSLRELGTDYGVLLLAKVGGFVLLGAAGYLHRRRSIPELAGGAEAPEAAAVSAHAHSSAAAPGAELAAPAAGSGTSRLAAPAAGSGTSLSTSSHPAPHAPPATGGQAWFWRVAVVEVVIMGAVSGLAVALAATPPPVPQLPPAIVSPAEELSQRPVPPEPTLAHWLTQWAPDVILALGALALAVVYLGWVRRLRRRGDAWPVGRTVAWLGAVAVLAWVTLGGPAVYGRVLFSAHMLQHMTLVMVVPILLVLAAPVTLALRALPPRADTSQGPREVLLGLVHSRLARFFGHPLVATVNFVGSMIVFYYTPLFELSLTTHIGHLAMVVHFLLAGYLFVNVLVGIDPGPTRPSYPMRLVVLFAAMAFHAFFGLAIMTMTALLAADYFGALGLPWGVDALADQRDGGALTWGIGEIPSLALAVTLAIAWARDDERTARRTDRAADRNDDAELKAYNAMLERMSKD